MQQIDAIAMKPFDTLWPICNFDVVAALAAIAALT
jgi:hypothetical protein